MVGWHHQLDGHVFVQAPEDSEEQGYLVCRSPWGHRELDMTAIEQRQLIYLAVLDLGGCVGFSLGLASGATLQVWCAGFSCSLTQATTNFPPGDAFFLKHRF